MRNHSSARTGTGLSQCMTVLVPVQCLNVRKLTQDSQYGTVDFTANESTIDAASSMQLYTVGQIKNNAFHVSSYLWQVWSHFILSPITFRSHYSEDTHFARILPKSLAFLLIRNFYDMVIWCGDIPG